MSFIVPSCKISLVHEISLSGLTAMFFSFFNSGEGLAVEAEDDITVGTVQYSVLSFQGLEKVLNVTHTIFTKVSSNDQHHSLLKLMYVHSFWQDSFCGREFITYLYQENGMTMRGRNCIIRLL